MENLKALTEAVCCVAREAGHFLKEERKSFRREVVQEKTCARLCILCGQGFREKGCICP